MEYIELTPNYAHMFQVMLKSATEQAEPHSILDYSATREQQIAALRSLQAILAPLNIAAQCMTNRESVETFREALAGMVTRIDTAAIKLENSDTDPTDGKGLL